MKPAAQKRKLYMEQSWCKGCGICVEYCPRGALELFKGKVALKPGARCVLCGLCELRCPDYVLHIARDDSPEEPPAPEEA